MKNITKSELIIYILVTMMISGASSIVNNDSIRILIMFVLLIYNTINQRLLSNRPLFFLLAGWCFVNLVSSLYFGKSIELYSFLGKIVLVYIAYLILSCSNDEFWAKYESFLYKLVVFSFFIYITSLLLPSTFNSLMPIFRPFTDDVFYQKESQKYYFYSFFFVYMGGENIFRNSGFMWEPGAYAMVLNILIAYNFAYHGVQLNKHVKAYMIALLTTFSTAGYLSFFILLLLFLLKVKSIYVKILIAICGFILVGRVANADFLLPKIEEYMTSAEQGEMSHQGYRDLYEANRILSFQLLFDKFVMFPLGWGCIQDTTSYMALKHIVTVNGLGNVLVTWGIFCFSFFMYSIYRFFAGHAQSILVGVFSLLALMVAFFSNPIENNILFYLLVLSPYVLKPKQLR